MKKYDAILLAGDRRASKTVCNENKAFLELENMPLFVYVMRALKNAGSIGDIAVVGPADRLEKTLSEFSGLLKGDGDIRIVDQTESMIGNVKAGFTALTDATGAETFRELRASEHSDKAVLIVPCDTPLLLPEEIDEFVAESDMDKFDYCIGASTEEVLKPYMPQDGKPGLGMILFHLKDCLFRHNNLHLARVLHFRHLDYIEKMYEWRYQTRFLNMLRLAFRLLFSGPHFFTALRVYSLMQLSLYYDRHHHPVISKRLRDLAPLETFTKGISRIIGADVQIVFTSFGGAVLDVDNETSLETIRTMYHEWMAFQQQLADSYPYAD